MATTLELTKRPRRLRVTGAMRELVRETHLRRSDLIAPLFVHGGSGDPQPVESMPGVYRLSIPQLVEECRVLADLGVRAAAIFPAVEPKRKDVVGSYGFDPRCFLYAAVRAVKEALGHNLLVITDVALDPFTDHGHDGLLSADGSYVENDRTVEALGRLALLEAEAGADIVAPSDMMDGRVGHIRRTLDAAGHTKTAILSYAAKFASALYGPFREAVGSLQAAGTAHLDKGTYQANPANRKEALKDALLDEEEGADMLMVKPAGWYMDVIRELREVTRLPVAAYQISGEYSMIHAAAERGWLDLERTREESLLGIKRAGADLILTYFAREMAQKLPA